MDETKPQIPANQPEETTLDLSKFSLGSEEPKEQPATGNLFQQPQESSQSQIANPTDTPEGKNLIAELNQMTQEVAPDIQIENIIIQNSNEEKENNQVLGSSGIGEKIENKTANTMQKIMLSYITIGISIVAIFIISLYSKYLTISGETGNQTEKSYVETYQDITKTISEYTNINDYALRGNKTDIMTASDGTKTTKEILSSKRLNYLHKKDILEKNMAVLSQNMINNASTLDNTKKEIIKYGFIPEKLYNTIEEQQGIAGIKKRIALMENIKLITAFKAFSYMESFIQGLANTINKDPLLIEERIKKITIDGEKDIINYTNNCFLNPYEITTDCNTIGDFDNYYKLIDTDRKVDTDFIKQLAVYVDGKLQETDIPTFAINFLNFNPKEEVVDFIIDLNTNTQDEIALNKQGILNPHVFIATNLINLLKQSLLVIGENIKADQIKTTPKTIRVGSTVFTVNNSSIKLTLPIQKNSQREISDFFSNK